MSRPELFGDLPETAGREAKGRGKARMQSPVRDQLGWQTVDLDSLLEAGHPVRVIWSYVAGLDLGALEERIAAREHTVGQAPVDPHLMLALWLYATADGVGSARALARLCESHVAYRWLCGGVSVNYHGLADFRTAHGAVLDGLLVQSAAGLALAGVVNLHEVVQDGVRVRVRAAAGAGSFRRKSNLHKELRKARRVVAQLQRETDDDPDASNRRIKAARERVAGDRAARHGRMDQRPLPQLGPAPVHGARRREGEDGAPPLRPGQQHPGQPPDAQSGSGLGRCRTRPAQAPAQANTARRSLSSIADRSFYGIGRSSCRTDELSAIYPAPSVRDVSGLPRPRYPQSLKASQALRSPAGASRRMGSQRNESIYQCITAHRA